MTRRCYTVKPAASEGRAHFEYGHTSLSDDPREVSGWSVAGEVLLCIGVIAGVVLAAVALGA